MAAFQTSVRSNLGVVVLLVALNVAFGPLTTEAQWLSPFFYDQSCPSLQTTVNTAFQTALSADPRIGASILRLHFHDCMVNGCDGSVLLNDTATIWGEQQAKANNNSLRGFDIVNDIKASVESACANTVSCADILALVARDAVFAAGGPYWSVELGRRDALNATFESANTSLPLANDAIANLSAKFAAAGLDDTDMVALTGAHTFGKAQCVTYNFRLWDFEGTNSPDPTIDAGLLSYLQGICPKNDSGFERVLTNLDQNTGTTFDNSYYGNLVVNKGVLSTDQQMQSVTTSDTVSLVSNYNDNQKNFFHQFTCSIIKMGRLRVLTGDSGEIRHNTCSFVNSYQQSSRRLQSTDEDICADESDAKAPAFTSV